MSDNTQATAAPSSTSMAPPPPIPEPRNVEIGCVIRILDRDEGMKLNALENVSPPPHPSMAHGGAWTMYFVNLVFETCYSGRGTFVQL